MVEGVPSACIKWYIKWLTSVLPKIIITTKSLYIEPRGHPDYCVTLVCCSDACTLLKLVFPSSYQPCVDGWMAVLPGMFCNRAVSPEECLTPTPLPCTLLRYSADTFSKYNQQTHFQSTTWSGYITQHPKVATALTPSLHITAANQGLPCEQFLQLTFQDSLYEHFEFI